MSASRLQRRVRTSCGSASSHSVPAAAFRCRYEIHLMVYLGPNAGVCACSNRTLEDFRTLHRTLRRNRATNFKFDLPKSKWFGNQKPATVR